MPKAKAFPGISEKQVHIRSRRTLSCFISPLALWHYKFYYNKIAILYQNYKYTRNRSIVLKILLIIFSCTKDEDISVLNSSYCYLFYLILPSFLRLIILLD